MAASEDKPLLAGSDIVSNAESRHPGAVIITEEEKAKLQYKIKDFIKYQRLSIFCGGPTGVGKTTLISGLLGTNLFGVDTGVKPTESLNRGTHKISGITFERNGVTVTVWDTPGLEGISETDDKFLSEVKEKCSKHDLFLYCINGSAKRYNEIFDAFDMYTKLFGKKVWKNAVIVLTQMNVYAVFLKKKKSAEDTTSFFQERIDHWKNILQRKLNEMIGSEYEVPIIPAGDIHAPVLPGHSENWFTELFEAILECLPFQAMLALLKLNDKRLKSPDENTATDSNDLPLSDQPIVISNKTLKMIQEYLPAGTGIAGTAVGATVGATIGGLFIGIPSFGTFAGIGLVGGALIGGAMGGGGLALITKTASIVYIKKKLKKMRREENVKRMDID